MGIEKKYAQMMYNYILETLLEQGRDELYLYALTVLHTGIRNGDILDLTWEQFDVDKFKDVILHKQSAIQDRKIQEDIFIRDACGYLKGLNKISTDRIGKMFSCGNKYVFTNLLRKYSGNPLMYSHELRILWARLL